MEVEKVELSKMVVGVATPPLTVLLVALLCCC